MTQRRPTTNDQTMEKRKWIEASMEHQVSMADMASSDPDASTNLEYTAAPMSTFSTLERRPPPAAHCRPQSSALREWLVQQEAMEQRRLYEESTTSQSVVVKTEEPTDMSESHCDMSSDYIAMNGYPNWMPQQSMTREPHLFRSPSTDATSLPTNLSKRHQRRSTPSATATSATAMATDLRRQGATSSHITSDGESSSGATSTSGGSLSADEINLDASKLFTHSDLALATIPGCEQFNPASCSFNTDELRPQPIIRKRKKVFVPEAAKDILYWDRRLKNNEAARRSREARRLKENQIALRAAFLEKENQTLKEQIDKMAEANRIMQEEVTTMRERLQSSKDEPRSLHYLRNPISQWTGNATSQELSSQLGSLSATKLHFCSTDLS